MGTRKQGRQFPRRETIRSKNKSRGRHVVFAPRVRTRSVAMEHHLDPMLVKAVVWRESRFDPKKYGGAGERGLMQVSEKAANEWARENKVDNFRVEKLFDPKTNLEAGTWYLRRAFE